MWSWLDDEMAALWRSFPIGDSPRPIVLIDFEGRHEGFFTDEGKIAWLEGLVEVDDSLPSWVTAMLPPRRAQFASTPVRVTAVTPVIAAFICDRGPRDLPAYELSITDMRGPCVVLDPEVACWWPRSGRRGWGGFARIDDDGLTVTFPEPWPGDDDFDAHGAPTRPHHVEFEEHGTYVVGRSTGPATGRLTTPLGDRVLVNARGQPLCVTRDGPVHRMGQVGHWNAELAVRKPRPDGSGHG